MIVHPDGSSTVLPMTGGIALGVVPEFEFSEATVKLSLGETAFLYTDGVTEAANADEEFFGLERLQDISPDPRPRTPGRPTMQHSPRSIHLQANCPRPTT